ncbi:hypothetical protein QQG09_02870 [Melissococcus plutonius]|nr:hypothetical protein [Melissococcus plutonius]BAL62219.1 hypothetical protein MPD5_0989 [Melissococcus plutonius DAT561]MCV2497990.1 hypothetical protein [Melissococcus plutonius]MCV2500794.1 hypothetical protein [Melissococcus plutonius]MCV2505330.1 hypothetical protein [Melissococcus plutonius]MCV2506605.1 hypothetical protein [Melissococcus plutonius]
MLIMLNPYFVIGVCIFLILLYLLFIYIYRKNHIHYLLFALLLISVFLTIFSFQVLQAAAVSTHPIHYDLRLLWIPFILGACLTIINLYRGIRQLIVYRAKRSKNNK